MEILIFMGIAFGFSVLKSREQKQRIALLSGHLTRFEIEKLMESLMEGYLRALGEGSADRQAQVWEHLGAQEDKLRDQFQQFAEAFSQVWADDALVSTLPFALPLATKIFPAASFDVRKTMQIHARGIAEVVGQRDGLAAKDRAYMLTAEMLLMQHTCHWFCRSKAVASARLLARHKTHYAQVLEGVSTATRQAYLVQAKGKNIL
jgi:hypothetical protein